MPHRYGLYLDDDGDWIIWESWNGERWVEHTRWLIPGTHVEG